MYTTVDFVPDHLIPKARCKQCGEALTFHFYGNRENGVVGRHIFTHPETGCEASGHVVGALGLIEEPSGVDRNT